MKTDSHKAPHPTQPRTGSEFENTNSPRLDPSAQPVAFPIPWEEEHTVTRRNFMSLLLLASTTFFVSTGLVGLVSWLRRSSARQFTPALIASIQEVPLGGVKLFSYPTSHDPCLLVHPVQGQFVAYGQKCTHLSCPVIYQSVQKEFFCPCHAGRFAVEDGRPIGGPPQRPLSSIQLKIIGTEIWAVGVEI